MCCVASLDSRGVSQVHAVDHIIDQRGSGALLEQAPEKLPNPSASPPPRPSPAPCCVASLHRPSARRYRVKWAGFDRDAASATSWELASQLRSVPGVADAVAAFHAPSPARRV
jgi:hypothetical protein